MESTWRNTTSLDPKSFNCGYCSFLVSSSKGYASHTNLAVYLCPHCDRPNVFNGSKQTPGSSPGNAVKHLPDNIHNLYEETRRCVSVNSFTGSVLLSRKLLMNIAVAQGAEENKRFVQYVDYLAQNGYVPPNGRGWVDHIRQKGNDATHEIEEMSREDAIELIYFLEMLLKFVYEFPSRLIS